jgi:hypothetical protein
MRLPRRKRRRGYTLVFFAMLLFGIMAMAALVIDIGFARLTQRQMQTAADSAALEGLRFRDEIPSSLIVSYETELVDACGPVQNDPTWRDCARRWFAAKRVSDTFDDDLDPDGGDTGNFGVGPVVNLTGSVGDPDINAGQLLTIPATPVFKPSLELNTGDNVANKHGDMVAGTFDFKYQYPDFTPPNGDTNPAINEYSDPNVGDYYVRRNFIPSSNATTADSFLVRMRRLHDDVDVVDTKASVSSKGPGIPYLFARGSLINRQLVQRGVVVRATAIADAKPVFSVGFADNTATPPLRGLVPFALELNYWQDLTNSTPDSQMLSGGEIGAPVVGRFFTVTNDPLAMPVMVGRELPAAAALPDDTYSGYVPIYDAIDDGMSTLDRVVGYGLVTAVVASGSVDITREPSELAGENAAANFLYPLTISSTGLLKVLTSNRSVDESSWMLAPISAR